MAQRVDQVLQRFQNFEKSTAADLQATLNKVSDLQEQFTIQQQQMILGGNSGISQTNSGQNGNIDQSKLKEMVINIIKEGQVMLRRPSTLAGTVGVLAAANAFKSQLTKKTSMNFNENSTQSFKNNSKDGEFIEDIEMELDDIKDQIQEMRDAIELIKEKDKNGQTKAFESQMQDLKKEMVSQQQKMEESISKLGTAQSYIKKQVQEQNPKEEIEGMNKRLRTMFNEIDELKLLHDRIYHVARRVENVESKTQDIWLMVEDIKRNIPPSADHLLSDMKAINISVQNLKNVSFKKVDDLKDEMRYLFAQNSTAELEVKMVDRMNDVVKALTKSMADRNDTRKNFRVIEKQMKNIFDIVMYQTTNGGVSNVNSPHRGSGSTLTQLLQQSDILFNHLNFHHTSNLVANQVHQMQRFNTQLIENDISSGYLQAKQIQAQNANPSYSKDILSAGLQKRQTINIGDNSHRRYPQSIEKISRFGSGYSKVLSRINIPNQKNKHSQKLSMSQSTLNNTQPLHYQTNGGMIQRFDPNSGFDSINNLNPLSGERIPINEVNGSTEVSRPFTQRAPGNRKTQQFHINFKESLNNSVIIQKGNDRDGTQDLRDSKELLSHSQQSALNNQIEKQQ
eukprot:403371164